MKSTCRPRLMSAPGPMPRVNRRAVLCGPRDPDGGPGVFGLTFPGPTQTGAPAAGSRRIAPASCDLVNEELDDADDRKAYGSQVLPAVRC